MCCIFTATWWELVPSRLSFNTRWQREVQHWRSSMDGLQEGQWHFMCICICLRRWTFSFQLLYYSPKSVSQRKVLVPESARKSSKQWILRDINIWKQEKEQKSYEDKKMVHKHSQFCYHGTQIFLKATKWWAEIWPPMTSHPGLNISCYMEKNTSQMW